MDNRDAVSIPSDLSDDLWGELPRFQAMKLREQQEKEKNDIKLKRNAVRSTLEQQLREQHQAKQKQREKEKAMDQLILSKAKEELDQEKQRHQALKQKTLANRDERDRQLREAQAKKQTAFQAVRGQERAEVAVLQAAIEKERADKKAKRALEREQAWVVIKENEEEKRKRLQDRETEKVHAQKLQADYSRMEDEKERKRAGEWAAREARIQDAMGRMADTVLKKGNQAEKDLEKRLLHYAN